MKLKLQLEQAGFFIAEVYGGARGHITFDPNTNLILDAGIARLLSQNADVLQYISVGSGSTAPAEGQTALTTRIATTNRNASSTYRYVAATVDDDAFGETKFQVQFDRGVAAGNLTEVGVGWNADGSGLWSRALFKDAGGTPTAITVLSDEFLRVTYVLRRYVPDVWTGSLTYDNDGTPATTAVTVSPGTNTGTNGLGSAGNVRRMSLSGGPVASFVSNPEPDELAWKIFYDLDYGNPSISSIVMGSVGSSGPQIIPAGTTITFTPPIPKTNEFDVTIDLLLTLARRDP